VSFVTRQIQKWISWQFSANFTGNLSWTGL